MFEIIFYRAENGNVPIEDFLNSLEPKMRVKAVNSLRLLEEFGNQLREPHSKAIGDGLFELRIRFSSDITRIFYFFYIGNRIVLTNGFVKKSQKTPRSELELARKYMDDFLRRNKHE